MGFLNHQQYLVSPRYTRCRHISHHSTVGIPLSLRGVRSSIGIINLWSRGIPILGKRKGRILSGLGCCCWVEQIGEFFLKPGTSLEKQLLQNVGNGHNFVIRVSDYHHHTLICGLCICAIKMSFDQMLASFFCFVTLFFHQKSLLSSRWPKLLLKKKSASSMDHPKGSTIHKIVEGRLEA